MHVATGALRGYHRAMAKPTFPWHNAFLAALREYPVLGHACDAVGIDRTTACRAQKEDEMFAKAVADAMEAGIDRAEKEAFRRGVVGFEEPVVYQGQLTPVWRRDEHGEILLVDVEMPDGSIERRPSQLTDANGRPVWLTVRKHSDAMLSLVLKGRRKAVYAERTEITGADGGPVAHSDETTRAARLAHLIDVARLRKEADELG